MKIVKPVQLFLVFLFFYGIMLILSSISQGFYQYHNDFWDIFFVTRHMVASLPVSWFNPQYPIGYTLLLKCITGAGSPVFPAIIFNIIVGMAIIIICSYFYFQLLPEKLSYLCIAILATFPTLFHYLTVGGGDPGSVLFFASGSFLVFVSVLNNNKKFLPFLFGGFLMGSGALFRYHVLPAVLLYIVIFVIFNKLFFKQLIVSGFGVAIAYLPQIIVNLSSGHALLETQFGPMNVYDLMYSMSWYQTITLDLPKSVFAIIAQDPLLFIKKYFLAFASFSPYFLPQIIAAIAATDKKKRYLCLTLSTYSVLYFTFFSAFTSGRQGLLLLPFAILCTGLTIESTIARFPILRKKGIPVLAALTVISIFIYKDSRKVQARSADFIKYKKIESVLIAENCNNVREVFSTKFQFYMPRLYPFVTYFNGGAPRWGTYKFNDEYPEFPVTTFKEFMETCRKRGVRFLVLTNNSEKLSPFFGEIFYEKVEGISLLFDDPVLKVFKINNPDSHT
ncbi:MAG TPA: hypothetical protein VHO70_18520 [Chitinispirillaceae bacterium]|nr:hypothetical protein [Chitinispirillaceae bacterium]